MFFGGGARSGKSYLLCLHEIIEATQWPGTRGLIAREEFTALRDSTMKTFFDEAIPLMGYVEGKHFTYNGAEQTITWANGSETMFRHMKYKPSDPNNSKIGSTAYTRVSLDEADEIDERLADMLRGRTGYKQPPHGGKMLVTGNPGEYWTKYRYVYTRENDPVAPHPKRRVVLATVEDNPDPLVRQQYRELMQDLNEYDKARLLYGDWLAQPRTGKEFFWAFKSNTHVRKGVYDPLKPLHIGLDFNRAPYMTLVVSQVHKERIGHVDKYVVQGLKEYCLSHPFNTTEAVCKAFLQDTIDGAFAGHRSGLYVYGDYSGKTAKTSTVGGIEHDYDVVWHVLDRHLSGVSDRVIPNPPHRRVSKWVNDTFNGLTSVAFYFDPSMSNSIRDFQSLKEDADGSILKEKVRDPATLKSMEKGGHCAQANYYIWTSLFHDSFEEHR